MLYLVYYVDCTSKISCICKRGHAFEITFSTFNAGHAGCKKCANIEQGSTKHWNYKNGESDVEEALRHCLISWKKTVKSIYGSKCAVTGAKTNIVVHHIKDFYDLLDESSKETGIPIYKNIGDYDDYNDFVLLKTKLIEKHTSDIGIAISRRVHTKYHSNYKDRANADSFDEFLRNHYNTSLEEIRKGVNYERQRK